MAVADVLHLVNADDVPRCGAETATGRPCRRQVSEAGDRCGTHKAARSGVRASVGSRRLLLEALRDRIAADIDAGVAARDLASLSKRLLDISKELDDLAAAEDGDEISEAAATPDEPWSG